LKIFQTEIPDKEADEIRSIKDAVDYIYGILKIGKSNKCFLYIYNVVVFLIINYFIILLEINNNNELFSY